MTKIRTFYKTSLQKIKLNGTGKERFRGTTIIANYYSAVMLRSLLLIFVIFCIKKPFISSDSVCYSFDFGLIDDVRVMYVYESLFQLQTSKIL